MRKIKNRSNKSKIFNNNLGNISLKISVFLMLFSLVFLSGCSETASNSSSSSSLTGTQGVSIKFLENMPPSQIVLTDNFQSFPITIQINNDGTYDLGPNDLVFSLSGVDPNLIEIPSGPIHLGEELNGKSQYLPGGLLIKELGDLRIQGDKIGNNYNPVLSLNAYYYYETKADIPVCIDPKSYDPNLKSNVCAVKDVSISSGQGAPISVVSVEEISSPSKAIFKIHFSNAGNGVLFSPSNSLDSVARTGINIKDENLLKIDSITLGGNALSCKGLSNNYLNVGNTLYCTYVYPSSVDAYSTVLNIKFSYNYKISLQKSLTINNIQ